MDEIGIRDVTFSNIDDLCRLCIPSEKRDAPTFIAGMGLKKRWAEEMLQTWGTFAKIAYFGSDLAGQIQYKPLPAHRVVFIDCIYVPEKRHWRRGVATRLLSSLMTEMGEPNAWFDGGLPLALVTKTFSGEKPGQHPAGLFFVEMGFKRVREDPDFLYYPLKEGFIYLPVGEQEDEYVPQEEDKGMALIIFGPSFCPLSYVFLNQTAQAIKNVAPGFPIRWIDKSEEPEEVRNRGGFEGCIVNTKPIRSFAHDREGLEREITEALKIRDEKWMG